METHNKSLQMSSCLWPMESYDFTVFDFKSITWNNSRAMVNESDGINSKIYSTLGGKTHLFTTITHKKWDKTWQKKNIAIIGVTYSQSPVDTQVQRDQDKVV